MHWAKDCQHKRSETANTAELSNETEDNPGNIIEEANIVLMTTDEVNPSSKIFKFGDGHKVTAISSVKIPTQTGEKTVLLSLKS